MRVLLTTDTIGGVWTFTKELTQQLLQQGHAVALVSFGLDASHDQHAWCSRSLVTHPNAFSYESSSISLEWMQDNQTSYDDGAAVLLETARHFKPDLLHSNQYCFGRLPIAIPKVITAHSDVLSWAAACKPQGLEPSIWLDTYRALVQQGLDSADAVVAPTFWMLDALLEYLHVPCRTAVIPNGRTLPRSTPTAQRLLQAISVGRLWDEAKGLSTLTSIASPMPLLLAGEDCFQAESALKPLTDFNALGHLSEEEILALFRRSSVYLATSIYEPFGLAPLEAALCGCAVVARDIPSFREVWGDAARYFSDGSTLEDVLQSLAMETTCLQSARRAAMLRAAQFTGERMATNYLALYEELLLPASANHPANAFKEEFASNAA